MLDAGDPICAAAALFSMDNYTLIAYAEPDLFHALLTKLAKPIYRRTEQLAKACPGHLWRICGPEYATEPYLPPHMFEDYVVRYTEPMVRTIQAHGGWVRLHCHGRIKSALPYIVGMGVDAIDPIEPHPQGDVDLAYVRREYGRHIALFGNVEVSDIREPRPERLRTQDGAIGERRHDGRGQGFSASCRHPPPYGREISPTTMANYETMVPPVTRVGKRDGPPFSDRTTNSKPESPRYRKPSQVRSAFIPEKRLTVPVSGPDVGSCTGTVSRFSGVAGLRGEGSCGALVGRGNRGRSAVFRCCTFGE